MTEHLLDLSATLTRDTIKLEDGTVVTLRNPGELGPIDEFRLNGLIKAVFGYDVQKMKTEEEAEKASADLHALAAMIIAGDLPEGVDDGSCAAIFGAWLEKHADPPRPTRPPRDRQPKKKSSTGAR